MTEVESAYLFWDAVQETLVHFYGFENDRAHQSVLKARGKLTKVAIARDMTYHSQPLHIAAKIAHVLKPISDEEFTEYKMLVERLSESRRRELSEAQNEERVNPMKVSAAAIAS